jgi:hypothetical protein
MASNSPKYLVFNWFLQYVWHRYRVNKARGIIAIAMCNYSISSNRNFFSPWIRLLRGGCFGEKQRIENLITLSLSFYVEGIRFFLHYGISSRFLCDFESIMYDGETVQLCSFQNYRLFRQWKNVLYNLRWNADGFASDGCPPDHEVGVGRNPQDAPDKRDRKELPS